MRLPGRGSCNLLEIAGQPGDWVVMARYLVIYGSKRSSPLAGTTGLTIIEVLLEDFFEVKIHNFGLKRRVIRTNWQDGFDFRRRSCSSSNLVV